MNNVKNETEKFPLIQKPDVIADEIENNIKTCFVIMPIADIANYETGHFSRVYEHIIKPACKNAGFTPIRSDEINSSHMIVVDILKKIVESDLAICDLSGRNPNVLYELGLRQAFNKKTVLIKDNKTDNIFDVQGFRYTLYDSSLRIDNVKKEIEKFSAAITETYSAQGDVNSIVQLLQIEPAQINNKTQLSESDTVIFRAVTELQKTVENLITKNKKKSEDFDEAQIESKNSLSIKINGMSFDVGTQYFHSDTSGKTFGTLEKIDVKNQKLTFTHPNGKYFIVDFFHPSLREIDDIPF